MADTDRLPKSVIALAVACAGAVIIAAVLVVVVIMDNRSTTDLNRELINQIAILTTQNRGPRGDDGLSAYEIWLSLGNTGSEAEFIESLRGEPGTPGIDGRDGVDGADGKPGSNGLSVGSQKCSAAGLNWYLTNGTYIGTTPMICIF